MLNTEWFLLLQGSQYLSVASSVFFLTAFSLACFVCYALLAVYESKLLQIESSNRVILSNKQIEEAYTSMC